MKLIINSNPTPNLVERELLKILGIVSIVNEKQLAVLHGEDFGRRANL